MDTCTPPLDNPGPMRSLVKLKAFATAAFDLARFYRRGMLRSRAWASEYSEYLAGRRADPPYPSIVHVIVTENCNLRCPMCNQWGENGYFATGKRTPSHAPIDSLTKFLGDFSGLRPNFLFSMNGGEPFMYRDSSRLLAFVAERKIDLLFYTNGTLLGHQAERLARLNRHMVFFVSVDGGRETHAKIRGEGVLEKAIDGVRKLREECLRAGTGLPKLMLNYTLSEHNPGDVDAVGLMAREMGAFLVNFNLRWFVPETEGLKYNQVLREEFGVKPSNAWTGWTTSSALGEMGAAVERLHAKLRRQFIRLRTPYFSVMPKRLSLGQMRRHYTDYESTFGITKCAMPSFMARIYSNGDLVYCPGHPDIIPGNVFRQDFREIYLNELSTRLRKRVEKELMPICNRCCGLYMTESATRHLGAGWNVVPNA